MALDTYRSKRDFTATPEPPGRKAKRRGQSFVIQKHAARRLHYDFRLELDGVLKSWAVTRGPSLVPSDKRLAIQVEDHPLEYGTFEGTIPKGEYGGGTVILWDRGAWKPFKEARKGLAKGHLEFELTGEKLSGRWHLVRMPKRAGERREPWLLIKGDDEFARGEHEPDILEERPESVKTGRMVDDVAGEAPGWSSKAGRIGRRSAKAKIASKAVRKSSKAPRDAATTPTATSMAERIKGARKATMPRFVEPSLAALVAKAPTGGQWLHEIKYDGYRIQARLEAGRVKLLTRNGHDWSKRFGKEILAAIQEIPAGRAIIDGEIVVETESGTSDFSALQADLSEGKTDRFLFYAFDLLHLDNMDLRGASLLDRKEVLRRLLPGGSKVLRLSEHFEEDGDLILRHACRLSLEGIISKQKNARYQSGRNKSWVKSKCSERQEFVIAGYVPSTTARKAVGSLLLGVFDRGKLNYVGRVGTGFTSTVAADLMRRLERLRTADSPFQGKKPQAQETRKVRYARPELVAEVEVRGWTADKILRHASFRGLREDKNAKQVVGVPAGKRGKAATAQPYKLTHPDRIYWPGDGVTKEGLADYYADVWRLMGPYVVDRPLALLRCPEGIAKQCFFQKHPWQGLRPAIAQFTDPSDKSQTLLSIDSLEGLMGLVQAGVLEIHPWGSRVSELERPDYITMDLDPGDGVPWQKVIDAAREVRERLERAGLTSFVKTTGGKGLHVVAPLKPRAEWPEVKAFTKSIAESMAADTPKAYVATVSKAKRRGKILVDYLRNGRGATAVAPYSTRARPGAHVSMPLSWGELAADVIPGRFTVESAPIRLGAMKQDPWTGFFAAAAPLPKPSRRRAKT